MGLRKVINPVPDNLVKPETPTAPESVRDKLRGPCKEKLVYVITVTKKGHGYANVAIATSHERAERFAHQVEEEGINADDIDIEMWRVNLFETRDDGCDEHDY